MTYRKLIAVVVGCVLVFAGVVRSETVGLRAKETLTAVEMNPDDILDFRLPSGRIVRFVLQDTEATIIEKVEPGGIIYTFSARLLVDGEPVTLRRYVCSQECFHEPYVINGVRLWLDAVRDVFDLIPIRYPRKGNLQCLPRKQARLALQDMTLRICPEEASPWIDDRRQRLNVGDCYNGDDCYLGPYLGQACHVGLDVNHQKGSFLSAPITFDTHAYFNSLEAGDNNNRWRGIRRWPNGDVWALQTHHLIKLLVPTNQPLQRGTPYATTAGVHVGSHEHTHFEFKIGWPSRTQPDVRVSEPYSIATPINFDDESQSDPEVIHLDPWIVFWQCFEDQKRGDGAILAAMAPLMPGRTGQPMAFSAEGSRAGRDREELRYHWTFGDGGCSQGLKTAHVFGRPGVYPVTLIVDDGKDRARLTQHVTISGKLMERPSLALIAEDEPSFRPRPAPVADTYGVLPRWIPHTLMFTARPSRPRPRPKIVSLKNVGDGTLAAGRVTKVRYLQGNAWLSVDRDGQGNEQAFSAQVDATGLLPGAYRAIVSVRCPNAANGRQTFRVRLNVPATPPQSDVTIDHEDPGFYATPYFWVGHRFCRCPVERRGHNGFYLTNGGRSWFDEFVRFTPDLQAGHYTVRFTDDTPFPAATAFDVRISHRYGEKILRVRPTESRTVGTFDFDEGTDGFVEIQAKGSTVPIIADALRFQRIDN